MRGAGLVALLFASFLIACGGTSEPTADAPPGETPTYRLDSVGFVDVVEVAGVSAALFGQRYEIPTPTIAATGGDCVLYKRPRPTCPQGCPEACIADNTCGPFAVPADAGNITITGLRQPLTIEPTQYGYISPPPAPDLFSDDAAIHIQAAGNQTAAFSADIRGVAPLEESPSEIALHDGQDEVIHWKAATGDARIEVALYLGWHGAPWTDLLICETADDGELTIPAQVFAPMSGFTGGLFQWASWVARYRRSYVDGSAGPIEIKVASMVPVVLSHEP